MFVRKDSPYKTFKDLQDSTLAYNCEASLSGYHCLKFFVKAFADDDRSVQLPFFKSVMRTGGHMYSVKAVYDGIADMCSLDCNVLAEMISTSEGSTMLSQLRSIELPTLSLTLHNRQIETTREGERERKLSINDGNSDSYGDIEGLMKISCRVSQDGRLGPNPAQPVVASNRLSSQQMHDIKQAFLGVADSVVPLPLTSVPSHGNNRRRRRKYVEVTSDYYNDIVMMMEELVDHQVVCTAMKGNKNLRSSVNELSKFSQKNSELGINVVKI